jgi:hypothetical protein
MTAVAEPTDRLVHVRGSIGLRSCRPVTPAGIQVSTGRGSHARTPRSRSITGASGLTPPSADRPRDKPSGTRICFPSSG